MTKLYDKDGNEIPKEDIAMVVCQAVSEVKRQRSVKLAEQIKNHANKVAKEGKEYTVADAYMVISVVKNYDYTYPFSDV